MVTCNTRNSRNARATPGIAFGTHIPPCAAPRTSKHNSDKTTDDDLQGSMYSVPGDDDFADGDDGSGNGDPDDPDNPDNEGPGNQINHPDNFDSGDENSEHGIQNNLADTIATLARNIQHQGDGSHSKV